MTRKRLDDLKAYIAPDRKHNIETQNLIIFMDELVAALETAWAELDGLRSDVQVYRGALGYAVPGDCSDRLSDGTIPVNGIAESQALEIATLTAKVREFKERAEDDWYRKTTSDY